MPKFRISSSIAKRFKVTANKNLLRRQAGKSHLLQKKLSSRKKRLSKSVLVTKQDIKRIKIKLSK